MQGVYAHPRHAACIGPLQGELLADSLARIVDLKGPSAHWRIVPAGVIVNPNPGSSPLPGVVVF